MRSDVEVADKTATMSQRPEESLELPKDKKYSLAVLQGKASGQIFPITKSRITLGRSGVDVLLDDPECSRKHAVIEIHGARITINDLGSTNGTFVDGKRIDKADLDKHTEFRIGEHVMMLIITDRE
jgi:pSer/pThr/pTyr-binding forkhead associated (FHA) protein